MRYIKTKDGIYEVIKEYKLPVGDETYYITNHKNFYSYEVLKQSDNIEELFDKIVRFYQFSDGQVEWEFVSERDLSLPDWKREYAFHIKEHHLEVRGAIFTEWGLKYVTRLNEKGDWELI